MISEFSAPPSDVARSTLKRPSLAQQLIGKAMQPLSGVMISGDLDRLDPATSAFSPFMNYPHVPAGPEAAKTSQPVTYLARTPQSSSSNTGLSPASAASIALLLSLFGLAALAFVICRTRRRRTTSKVLDEQPSEKAVVLDVEALAATCPIVPVTPLPDVRWTPQIRSISGPAPSKDRKLAALPTKRARSPPPTNFIKSQSLFPDPHTKSTPPHTLSFSQGEIPRLTESSRGDPSPPVTPQALAVSGMQIWSLARSGVGSES